MKTLLFYSGGLDSICALWHMLDTTDDEIYVQHIHHKCEWPFWEAEAQAVESSLAYITPRQRFFHRLPDITYENLSVIGPFTTLFCMLASPLMQLNDLDRAIMVHMDGTYEGTGRGVQWMIDEMEAGYKIFNRVNGNRPRYLDFPYKNQGFTKQDWLKLVPPRVRSHAITCRFPDWDKKKEKWLNCGECNNCKRMEHGLAGKPLRDNPAWPWPFPKYFDNEMPTSLVMVTCPQDMMLIDHLIKSTDDNLLIQQLIITDKNTIPDEEISFKSDRMHTLPTARYHTDGILEMRLKVLLPALYGSILMKRYRQVCYRFVSVREPRNVGVQKYIFDKIFYITSKLRTDWDMIKNEELNSRD